MSPDDTAHDDARRVVSSAIPFNQRPASAPAQEPLNSHLPLAFPSSATTSRIMLSSTADPTSYNYRYMYERMMERSESKSCTVEENSTDSARRA